MQPRRSVSRSLLIVAKPYLVDSAKGGASGRYVSLLQAGADRLFENAAEVATAEFEKALAEEEARPEAWLGAGICRVATCAASGFTEARIYALHCAATYESRAAGPAAAAGHALLAARLKREARAYRREAQQECSGAIATLRGAIPEVTAFRNPKNGSNIFGDVVRTWKGRVGETAGQPTDTAQSWLQAYREATISFAKGLGVLALVRFKAVTFGLSAAAAGPIDQMTQELRSELINKGVWSGSLFLFMMVMAYLVDEEKAKWPDGLFVIQFICAMVTILIFMWKTSLVRKSLRERLGSLSFDDIEGVS